MVVGTPWEPAENLNRVAPAGVSLVVTGCSQGPVGPLNSAGEKLSPGISHSASVFSHSSIRVFTWISIDFFLAKCLCNHWKYKLVHFSYRFGFCSSQKFLEGYKWSVLFMDFKGCNKLAGASTFLSPCPIFLGPWGR